ncbi:SDR family oxidoreductase [Jatrophihabitans sp. DSM 44399]|uniref:SDR family oxidoreductase n=1 Tax=Jatrophihabitans lederbergiae TaxID=3075547 RepID=A0ABU2JI50_9ACTN|nr:SDR family oxidoreductase [Jatrophihabitans sp. DSM 44399]MDT0264169.1 SDR family oxidoreductase [Jatrophihabitans sp. DSM 44399]
MYGGSKAALRACVRGWIQEVKGTGIRLNMFSPGAVDTPSMRLEFAGASRADKVDERVAAMGQGIPMGRLIRPEEVAKSVAFLSSEDASGITGVELFVDGGVAQTGGVQPGPARQPRHDSTNGSKMRDGSAGTRRPPVTNGQQLHAGHPVPARAGLHQPTTITPIGGSSACPSGSACPWWSVECR